MWMKETKIDTQYFQASKMSKFTHDATGLRKFPTEAADLPFSWKFIINYRTKMLDTVSVRRFDNTSSFHALHHFLNMFTKCLQLMLLLTFLLKNKRAPILLTEACPVSFKAFSHSHVAHMKKDIYSGKSRELEICSGSHQKRMWVTL